MMPSVPSDPRNNRSGDGPAPLPGSRRDSLIPTGVTIRSDSVVNLKHRAHGSDVDRDHRLIEARLDTANHRAATTVWDDRNPLARTPIQHVDHVLLAAGSGDEVGQVVELALQVACDVAIRFAARVSGPIDEIA